jgi:hypothetical protein
MVKVCCVCDMKLGNNILMEGLSYTSQLVIFFFSDFFDVRDVISLHCGDTSIWSNEDFASCEPVC